MKTSILALLLAAVPFCCTGDILFEENFESHAVGSPIPQGGSENAWRINSDTPDISDEQASIGQGQGVNTSQVAITTPLNVEEKDSGTFMNISASFGDTTDAVRISFDVYPERGSGQIMLRAASGDPSQGLARLHFRASPNMEICAFVRSGEGEMQPLALGKFHFGRWYKVQITLHPEQSRYDVEVMELDSGESVVSAQGLDFNDPVSTFGNILVGAVFGANSRFAWDNIKVETLR